MKKRLLSAVCVAVLFSCLFTVPSFAYFNRGTVTMQLGQTSVSVAEGRSVSVSVTVNPISEQQLPGCGMAECLRAAEIRDASMSTENVPAAERRIRHIIPA